MLAFAIGAMVGAVFGLLFGTLMARVQIEEEEPYAQGSWGDR